MGGSLVLPLCWHERGCSQLFAHCFQHHLDYAPQIYNKES